MSLEISKNTRNNTSPDSTMRAGEPMAQPTPSELVSQQQRQFFADALDIGVYPIIDKDAAEDTLDDFRRTRRRSDPKVIADIEAGIRDGNPIMSHVAITRLRQELAELINR